MASTVTITFKIDTTDASALLGFEAWIDNHKFFESDHVSALEQISTQLPDDSANHELRLVMKNKTVDHTKIDEAGNIISDARLVITDLAFDEILLGHVVTEQAVYAHDLNGSGTMSDHKFYGEIGCNGVVSLKFATPMYLWLLEHL
jgi:hypothetical protein